LTAALALAGLLQAALLPRQAATLGLGASAGGLAVGLLVPFVFFAINALGAGDVKLLAAIGAWVGAKPILLIMLAAAILGGVLAVIQGLMQRRLALLIGNTALLAANLMNIRRFGVAKIAAMGQEPPTLQNTIPYGVAIAAATILFVAGRCTGWM
jgi:prepilin peptidase CpaA